MRNTIQLARTILLLVLALLPLYYVRFPIGPIPTNVIEIAIAVATLLILWDSYQTKKWGSIPYFWLTALLIIGILVSTLVAPDMRVALGILKGWFVVPIAFAWSLIRVYQPELFPQIRTAIAVNLGLVSGYTIFQALGYLPLLPHQTSELGQYIEQGRALAFFESPNYIAMYLVPPSIFLFYTYVNDKVLNRWSSILFLLPIIAIYLSGSKAGMIALTVGVILVLQRMVGKFAARIFATILALTGVVLLLSATPLFSTGDTLRQFIWEQAAVIIRNNPIFGIGPGQFYQYFLEVAPQTDSSFAFAAPFALHPHNIFLSFWLSGGLLGLIGFLWLVWRALKDVYSNTDTPVMVASGIALATILVHGIFDTTYFKNDLSIFFWFFIAMIWIHRSRLTHE